MNPMSLPLALRAGFLLLSTGLLVLLWEGESTAGIPVDASDPDEAFVVQTGKPVGKLSFQIIDASAHVSLPARLYFAYADGREEEPVVGRFKNFIVTASGREVKTIPTGEYDVYITRGTEYSLNHHKISIVEGKTTHIDSRLARVVDTSGFISSDFHLHLQFEMRDGAMVSAAEGIDLLTATDHNVLKDYAPYIESLSLERFMKSVVGSELDTAFGHFNSFPLSADRWSSRTFRHAIRTPAEFFRIVRQDPGEQIIQVNHPRRWEPNPTSGYFDQRLNAETGEAGYPYFDGGFDSFEIYNSGGDKKDGHMGRTALVEQKLTDWYGFLNRGILAAGVANSDAHRYPEQLPGYPRNYVVSDTDKPWEIDPEEVVTAIKRRNVTGSGGPFIRFTGNGEPVGSVVSDLDGNVSLRIEVQAPHWIPVERVEVIRNGELLQTYPVSAPEEDKPWHFAAEMIVKPERDSWYLVLATSDQRWSKPFTQFSSFSFTNPIFVDVDGNGYFDAPNGGYSLTPTDD